MLIMVEIDTLWNVKKTMKTSKSAYLTGRNRYIVECKVCGRERVGGCGVPVEIDTLWNVKDQTTTGEWAVSTVEIDTLWNVKSLFPKLMIMETW